MPTHSVYPSASSAQTLITAAQVANGSPRIADCRVHNAIPYWLQSMAEEKGRMGLFRILDKTANNILPAPFGVRSKVHEYGGAAYCFSQTQVFFVEANNQQIYRHSLDQHEDTPIQLSHATDCRFGDLQWDEKRQSIVAVCEDHSSESVENYLVYISLDGHTTILHQGADFYAYPRLNHDCTKLCWISWQRPNMPWDETHLHIASLSDDSLLENCIRIKDNERQSILQPLWNEKNELFFISDASNWWNIYSFSRADIGHALKPSSGGTLSVSTAKHIHKMAAEFATPLWVLGMQNYAFINPHTLFTSFTQHGKWQTALIDTKSGNIHVPPEEFSSIESVCSEQQRSDASQVYFIGNKPDSLATIFTYDRSTQVISTIHSPGDAPAKNSISIAESIYFPTHDGSEIHAFYYPGNPASNKNALIVICHGGPTGQTNDGLNYKIQYWTARGFSVVDVNYRGSTGFGRLYRESLYNKWGLSDVEDVVAASKYLIQNKGIESNKVIIKGSSAGGYTVLAALTFSDTFSAGVSLYGIGDLSLLAEDTHKFEADYLEQLVGPYPEAVELYRARSPIEHTEKLNCPTLLFQGLEDKVVPPEQAVLMAKAVENKGLPIALVEYPNEGHGFRDPENIEHMLNAELYFYEKIFNFENTTIDMNIDIKNI